MNTKPRNSYPLAALVVSFHGAKNKRGSRYKVTTQRGSAFFPAQDEFCPSENARIAAASMLARIATEDRAKYGPDAKGWGGLGEYVQGNLPDGKTVFVYCL